MKRGFTLVELLVVIGIIAILSVLAVPNFMGARQKARDAIRKSDLRQLQSALELYKDDQKPVAYPAALSSLATTYIKAVPNDPLSSTGYPNYGYTNPSSLTYTITACLENKSDPSGKSCTCGGVANSWCYTVTEP